MLWIMLISTHLVWYTSTLTLFAFIWPYIIFKMIAKPRNGLSTQSLSYFSLIICTSYSFTSVCREMICVSNTGNFLLSKSFPCALEVLLLRFRRAPDACSLLMDGVRFVFFNYWLPFWTPKLIISWLSNSMFLVKIMLEKWTPLV